MNVLRLFSAPVDGRIIGFIQCRNEILRLPWLLTYYRRLGVESFVVLDNASTDGTIEFLVAQPDVCLYVTDELYRNGTLKWQHHMLYKHGLGKWCLVVDCDEILVYPGVEEHGLSDLCLYLDQEEAGALVAPIVDCYSDKPILRTEYNSGNSFIESCPYFDAARYNFLPAKLCPWFRAFGGVRQRVFFSHTTGPLLVKVPLVKWATGKRYFCSTHLLTDTPLTPFSGALLHFKFIHTFHESVEFAVKESNHWDHSAEYRAYKKVLHDNPELCLYGAMSRRYESPASLEVLGLCQGKSPW